MAIESDLESYFENMNKKFAECKDGHKDPHDLVYWVTSRSNPLRDNAQGYCKHCHAFYDRPLRSEELEHIHAVQRMLHGGSDVFMKASRPSDSYRIGPGNP